MLPADFGGRGGAGLGGGGRGRCAIPPTNLLILPTGSNSAFLVILGELVADRRPKRDLFFLGGGTGGSADELDGGGRGGGSSSCGMGGGIKDFGGSGGRPSKDSKICKRSSFELDIFQISNTK